MPRYRDALFLELGGDVIAVRDVAGCVPARFNELPMDCRLTLPNVPPPAILTWIQQAADGLGSRRTFRLIEADLNANKIAELTVRDAFIKRAALPELDAASGRENVGFELTLVSDEAERAAASGKLLASIIKPKTLLASNFRVTAGSTQLSRVAKVSSLAFDVAVLPLGGGLGRGPGAVSFDPVTLNAAVNEAGLRPWASDASAGKGARSMVIDFLSVDLASTLLSWRTNDSTPLGDVSPFALGTGIDSVGRIELEVQGNGAEITAAP